MIIIISLWVYSNDIDDTNQELWTFSKIANPEQFNMLKKNQCLKIPDFCLYWTRTNPLLTLRGFWYTTRFCYIICEFWKSRDYISNGKYPNITGFHLGHVIMYCNLTCWSDFIESFKTMYVHVIFPGFWFSKQLKKKNLFTLKSKMFFNGMCWYVHVIPNIIQYLIFQSTRPPNQSHEVIRSTISLKFIELFRTLILCNLQYGISSVVSSISTDVDYYLWMKSIVSK